MTTPEFEVEVCDQCRHEHVCTDVQGTKLCIACADGELCPRELTDDVVSQTVYTPS